MNSKVVRHHARRRRRKLGKGSQGHRDKILRKKDYDSGQLTLLCRAFSFGIIAFSSAFLTSDQPSFDQSWQRSIFALSLVMAVISLIFDYLQFVCGYCADRKALKAIPNDWDDEWMEWQLRHFFFKFKQIPAFIGSLLFLIAVLPAVFLPGE